MKNLLTLRQFKDTYREWYSKLRQLNEAKEVVSELRDYWLQELPPSAKDLISYCSTLLKLDYSLENLQKLRRFKDNFKKDYQKCKRSRYPTHKDRMLVPKNLLIRAILNLLL